MENPTVVFPGPGVVELEERPVPSPGPGEVLLRTRRTLISPGTELTILAGDFPPGSAWDRYGQFPFVAGYSAAAEVTALGEGVESIGVGDIVAARTPHCPLGDGRRGRRLPRCAAPTCRSRSCRSRRWPRPS